MLRPLVSDRKHLQLTQAIPPHPPFPRQTPRTMVLADMLGVTLNSEETGRVPHVRYSVRGPTTVGVAHRTISLDRHQRLTVSDELHLAPFPLIKRENRSFI